jgi:hypothetical protein
MLPRDETGIFWELLTEAKRTGKDQRRTLRGGAVLVVRLAEGWIYLTAKRCGAPVGATEETTFIKCFRIPPYATRYPLAGQLLKADPDDPRKTWQFFTYAWKEPER